jgi:tyrosine-protein phosphatase YwqE
MTTKRYGSPFPATGDLANALMIGDNVNQPVAKQRTIKSVFAIFGRRIHKCGTQVLKHNLV